MMIDLSDKERAILVAFIRREIRKALRQRAKQEAAGKVYVPPPGMRHWTDSKVEALTSLARKIESGERSEHS